MLVPDKLVPKLSRVEFVFNFLVAVRVRESNPIGELFKSHIDISTLDVLVAPMELGIGFLEQKWPHFSLASLLVCDQPGEEGLS